VSINKDVTCSTGGSSIPISVSVSNRPWADISVNLAKTTYNASVAGAVDPSHGMTVSAAQVATFKSDSRDVELTQYLSFACATNTTGTGLTVELKGTDKLSWSL